MRCVSNFNECDCNCHYEHEGFSVHHIVPCCSSCGICGSRIRFGYEAHVKECEVEFDKNMEEAMGRPLTEEEKTQAMNMRRMVRGL